MVQQPTLLGVYAHPDDEIIGVGGTLARYAAAGARVVLVIATRGEAGEIARPGAATPETLPQVREQEMRCSAAALGVTDLIFLDYRDSGMAGSPDNDHPDALINVPAGEVVGKLVAIMRRLQPHVVHTFEPFGGYGHPDHVAIHHHTVAAFHAAGDPQQNPEAGPIWQPARLFYPLVPDSVFVEMKERVAALGGDIAGYDELLQGRRDAGVPDYEAHAVLDVADHIRQKWAAWDCHQTQFGPDSRFRRLPDAEMQQILSREYFHLAYPAPGPGLRLDDLFDGLSLPASAANA
jgi:LmbE family N-acetylglucosaminyl deacetylase